MTDSIWYLLDQGAMNGSVNMALDEVLLSRVNSRPVLRFYQWETPVLTLGLSQPVERHVDIEAARSRKIPVIRRLTGGKAVLHSSELTYSITGSTSCSPFNNKLLDSYREIAAAFCQSFQDMGLNVDMASRETRSAKGSITSCFASPSAYEIVVNGKKLLGSAQRRTRNRVLQHGSLLIDYRGSDWEAVMKRKAGIDVHRIVDLRSLLGKTFSLAKVKQALMKAFESRFNINLEPMELTSEEKDMVMKLARERYFDLADTYVEQDQ